MTNKTREKIVKVFAILSIVGLILSMFAGSAFLL